MSFSWGLSDFKRSDWEDVRCFERPLDVWGWKQGVIKHINPLNTRITNCLQLFFRSVKRKYPLPFSLPLRVQTEKIIGTNLVILHPVSPRGKYYNQSKHPFHYLYILFYTAILQMVNHHFTRFILCLEHINLLCLQQWMWWWVLCLSCEGRVLLLQ